MKYLILGAGPAGLTMAHKLIERGEKSVLVLEQENTAGGLCRSVEVDHAPFDIGGGHFLDNKRPLVNDFLFRFMPENEWNIFARDSQIKLEDNYVHHPLEANIWELPSDIQLKYLQSISQAGCNQKIDMPKNFVDWIRWKLGDLIADNYMLPYNEKIFADELENLGIYWLDKLPNVSYEETLDSCKYHKAFGKQPGHARFFYPKKYGYGELWHRMADELEGKIEFRNKIKTINFNNTEVMTINGEKYAADKIITTIPWRSITNFVGMPDTIQTEIEKLSHNSIETRYIPQRLNTTAHWIYEPDKNVPYHRILVRHNFCERSRGYWMETRAERVKMFQEKPGYAYLNEYAYPLNTIYKPKSIGSILCWAKEQNVYGLGRWGEHQHYNSDVTVERAMQMSEWI